MLRCPSGKPHFSTFSFSLSFLPSFSLALKKLTYCFNQFRIHPLMPQKVGPCCQIMMQFNCCYLHFSYLIFNLTFPDSMTLEHFPHFYLKYSFFRFWARPLQIFKSKNHHSRKSNYLETLTLFYYSQLTHPAMYHPIEQWVFK